MLVAVESDSGCADPTTPLHYGHAKVWAEDDWDVARSFCHLRLSFANSCLSASNLQQAFLTDERQLSQSEAMSDG